MPTQSTKPLGEIQGVLFCLRTAYAPKHATYVKAPCAGEETDYNERVATNQRCEVIKCK